MRTVFLLFSSPYNQTNRLPSHAPFTLLTYPIIHTHNKPSHTTFHHRVKRTGYCGVKIELPRPLHVENYEGLELRVRTDGRNYVTNLEVRI